MRKAFSISTLILMTVLTVFAPSSSSGQATAGGAAKPTAIIDTTAGKMTCTLFPDKAPIGVENFIGRARGRVARGGDDVIDGSVGLGVGAVALVFGGLAQKAQDRQELNWDWL